MASPERPNADATAIGKKRGREDADGIETGGTRSKADAGDKDGALIETFADDGGEADTGDHDDGGEADTGDHDDGGEADTGDHDDGGEADTGDHDGDVGEADSGDHDDDVSEGDDRDHDDDGSDADSEDHDDVYGDDGTADGDDDGEGDSDNGGEDYTMGDNDGEDDGNDAAMGDSEGDGDNNSEPRNHSNVSDDNSDQESDDDVEDSSQDSDGGGKNSGESSQESDSPAGLSDASNDPVVVNAMGRRLQAAAIAAADTWEKLNGRQPGSATRRSARRVVKTADSTSEEATTNRESDKVNTESDDSDDASDEAPDAPTWTEAILNRLVDKMTSEDGVVHYRADWADYQSKDERYTWEPVAHLEGHEEWMELVDVWKRKYPTKKKSFAAFAKTNGRAIRIGAGEGMRCFFHAIRAVRELLQLPVFDLDGIVATLTAKGWDFEGGVKKATLIPLMEALCKSGLQLNYVVWKKNLHESGMGGGALGIAEAAREPGVYMVFTMDPRRLGHCWVLHQDDDYDLTAYDNGGIVKFDKVRFDSILWVRKCVPFRLQRRRSRYQRKLAKREATAK